MRYSILEVCQQIAQQNGYNTPNEETEFNQVIDDPIDFAELLVKTETIISKELKDEGISETDFYTVKEYIDWTLNIKK